MKIKLKKNEFMEFCDLICIDHPPSGFSCVDREKSFLRALDAGRIEETTKEKIIKLISKQKITPINNDDFCLELMILINMLEKELSD